MFFDIQLWDSKLKLKNYSCLPNSITIDFLTGKEGSSLLAMFSTDLDLNPTRQGNTASEVNTLAKPPRLKLINRKDKMPCNRTHVRQFDESTLPDLEEYQVQGKGIHKCCQCGYNSGFQQGALLQTFISLDIESLGDAHVSPNGRYKSVHQAFSLGYRDGVNSFIRS